MDGLSETLMPLKGVVGAAAAIMTVAQFFVGVPICNEIIRKRSTEGHSAVPFLGNLTMGILFWENSYLLDDNLMFFVSIIQITLFSCYSLIFVYYCTNRMELLGPSEIFIGLSACFLIYASIEDPELVEFRYEVSLTLLNLILMGRPLIKIDLSQTLMPIKGLVGAAAAVMTIAQFSTGILICQDIINKQSTEGYSAIPIMGSLILGILFLENSLIIGDNFMFCASIFQILSVTCYCGIYFYYHANRAALVLPSQILFGMLASLLIYVRIEDPEVVEFRYGVLLTLLNLVLMGRPLIKIPHKDLIGSVASVVTIAQFFSGVFICKDIYKNQHTKGANATPFIGGIAIGFLMLQYAIMLEDIAMLQVNTAAIVLNIVYILFFYFYCSERWHQLFKPGGYAVALVGILIAYINYEDPALLEFRYGLIITVLMLLLLGSPLLELNAILKEKDASSIPFPMTLMGAIVTFLWLIYGIILLNYFMVVQNVLGFILCATQLGLCFMYPKPKSD